MSSIDYTTDNSNIESLTCVRYVGDCVPVERSVTSMANTGRTGQQQAMALLEPRIGHDRLQRAIV